MRSCKKNTTWLLALLILEGLISGTVTQGPTDAAPLTIITSCYYPKGSASVHIECPYNPSIQIESVDTEDGTVRIFSHDIDSESTINLIGTNNISDYFVSPNNTVIQEYDKPVFLFQHQKEKRTPLTSILQQLNPTWGPDRVSQRNLPLDFSYSYNISTQPVTIYILDTGIRYTHQEFGSRVVSMVTCNTEAPDFDGNGHGTHVAGIAAGYTYGISKRAKIGSVKVLNSGGSGTTSGVMMGLSWVINNGVPPYVVNLSLGGGVSPGINQLVNQLSGMDGVVVAAAAGNAAGDACLQSPAGASNIISVGSTAQSDHMSTFSNIGPCVTIFAPGELIQSSWKDSDTAFMIISGTSMSSPLVAGIASVYLAGDPTIDGIEVRRRMVQDATPGVIAGIPSGTTNLLAYIFPTEQQTTAPTQAPTVTPTINPTVAPTRGPTGTPTRIPTGTPTRAPTGTPTRVPTRIPTNIPTRPHGVPPTSVTAYVWPTKPPATGVPTRGPSITPTSQPTRLPSIAPAFVPTRLPSIAPTSVPTRIQTSVPTRSPTAASPVTQSNIPPTITPPPMAWNWPTKSNAPTTLPSANTVSPTGGTTGAPIINNDVPTAPPVTRSPSATRSPIFNTGGPTPPVTRAPSATRSPIFNTPPPTSRSPA
jgi:subtilisin family serine protease